MKIFLLLILILFSGNSYAGTQVGATNVYSDGTNIGVGTANPVQKLEVNGTTQMTGFKLTTNPSAGYVLTSSSVGLGTWMPAAGGGSGTVSSGTADRVAIYDTAGTTVVSSLVITDDNTNVGIGSTAPGTKFDVTGTIRASTDILVGAQSVCQEDGTNCPASAPAAPAGGTNAVQWNNAGTTAGTEAQFSFNGTNIGMGTTNGTQKLDVRGRIVSDDRVTATNLFLVGDGSAAQPSYVFSGSTNTGAFSPASNVYGIGVNGSEKFRIDTNGNVGIGTVDTARKFIVQAATDENFKIRSATADGLTAGVRVQSIDNASSTIKYLRLDANPFVIQSGNVGIGTEIPPNLLYVAGTAEMQGLKLPGNGAASSYVLTSNSVGLGTWMPAAGGSTSPVGGEGAIQYSASGAFAGDASKLYYNGTNVGIGTTTAPVKLTTSGGIRLYETDDWSRTGVDLISDTNGGYMQLSNGGAVRIQIRPAAASYMTNISNFGIEDTTPDFEFEVVGDMGVSSTAAGDGDLFVVTSGGNVGIGSTSPYGSFQVGPATAGLNTNVDDTGVLISIAGATAVPIGAESRAASSSAAGSFIGLYSNDAAAMASGDRLGGLLIGGSSSATASRNVSLISSFATENWSDGVNYGSDLRFETTANGGTTRSEKVRISGGGNVGIGTDMTSSAGRLLVIGGNVGIGTITPGTALDVNGTTRLSNSGDSYFGGNVGVGTTIPMNTMAIQGSLAVGTVAFTGKALETNAVAFSGNVGIGTQNVSYGLFNIDPGTGTGQVRMDGSAGGCLMFRDTDDAGWTECDALDGTLSCSIDTDGICD